MPRNPSGTAYSKPNTFGLNPPEVISSSKMNANFDDIGTELVNSLPRDGRAAMTGQLRAVAGVGSLPGYAFDADPDTGLRWLSSGEFAFTSNGVDVISVGPDGIIIDKAETLVSIGDFYDTARALDARFLRRNGGIYANADYPTLAALMGPLPDTIGWTPGATGQSNPLYAIAQDGGSKYRAVGNNGTLLASSDRETWAAISPGTAANLQFIVKAGAFWLAAGTLTPSGGSVTVRSPDGDTWTQVTLAAGNYMTEIRGLTKTAANVLVTGYDSTSGVVHKVLYGTDGTSWTAVTVPTSGPIAASPSRVVMVSKWDNSGMVLTSDNQGATWTTRVASNFGNVNDVCWDPVNNLFIAVFDGGIIKTSPDGIAWTTRASGTTSNLLSVRAGPNGAIAAGNGLNFVLFSSNGTSWTSKSAPTTTGRALLADNTAAYHFLSGGSTTINDGLRTSPTQFQVPDDQPTYGWIRALNELP